MVVVGGHLQMQKEGQDLIVILCESFGEAVAIGILVGNSKDISDDAVAARF
jgi:hypothetical protein